MFVSALLFASSLGLGALTVAGLLAVVVELGGGDFEDNEVDDDEDRGDFDEE